ncbi:MAG TPA: alpha/beta hydrolase, partial [Actinopolymorphaceae bacterium]
MTEPTTGSVRSKDGTEIGYQSIGQGPGLVIVHGGMEWGRSHLQLATELSDTCTVFLPDRRGRGRSGPYGEGDDVLDVEVEDLDALPAATGARQVLGVSSGAIIVLRAATMLPALERVVAFEPPLPVHPSFRPEEWMPLFDRRIEEDDEIGALTTALRGAQLGPPILSRIPRRVVEFLTRVLTA